MGAGFIITITITILFLFLEETSPFLTPSSFGGQQCLWMPAFCSWDSSLSKATSLLFSALQTPPNKLFQFSVCLLPMWPRYGLTRGIPGLQWALYLTPVSVLRASITSSWAWASVSHSALYPISQPSPPPPPAATIFQFSDSTLRPSPRPWTGNFTACYNFAFVIRSTGQTSKAPFSLFPLPRFDNHPHQLLEPFHCLNLEPPDFYLGRQNTPAS